MDHLQQRTSFLDIFHLESNYPVFSRICDFLPIASILNLTQTSKSLANLYRVLLPYQWNINRSLHRFVNQPAGLRSQLGKCTALISGSFALQFFERVFWDESDLDIFVQDGRGSGELGLYLAEEEGYVLDSTKGRDRRDYIQPDIVEIWTLLKRDPATGKELEVQLILTLGPPVQAILRGFYATIVVNFLSWSKAYAIYPIPTFFDHKGYMLRDQAEFKENLASKYRSRGWSYEEVEWPKDNPADYLVKSPRRVGDRYTWQINLDTVNVSPSQTPDSVLDHAEFGVRNPFGWKIGQHRAHYPISATVFKACTLRHEYLYAPNGWIESLQEKMDQFTDSELHKLTPAERPANDVFEGLIGHIEGVHQRVDEILDTQSWVKPDTWSYYDCEMPNLYCEWQQRRSDEILHDRQPRE